MKVIDLLNKIAKGKEYPKIKFNNSIYEYHDKEHGYCRYYHDNTYICLNTDYYLLDILNDEVEIIEEEKKIEKIDLSEWVEITYREDWEMLTKDFNRNCNLFVDKINEIIDYLEENK